MQEGPARGDGLGVDGGDELGDEAPGVRRGLGARGPDERDGEDGGAKG